MMGKLFSGAAWNSAILITKACELRSAIEAANNDTVVDPCSSGSAYDRIVFVEIRTIVLYYAQIRY